MTLASGEAHDLPVPVWLELLVPTAPVAVTAALDWCVGGRLSRAAWEC